MDGKLLKPYDPKETEGRIYKLWEESGFFNPDNLPGSKENLRKETFSMVLPPPNVTGTLHTGHALMLAIEDVMTRHARMSGKKTLWVPGTDHAAIATESVVVKQLAKEKKNKNDLGREEFLKLVDGYAKTSHDTIVNQLKKMGASLDWSREAFTLDDKRKKAVNTAFERMYKDGLIYRGQRVVNWDPKGQTTISDDEVEYKTQKTKLYFFKYDKNFPITIATTRPETKLGDTAVAVNPDDERYAKYVGKTFEVNFVGVPLSIKVVADRMVDKEFGTGALGVTPAHSQIDWEIAERNNLDKKQVINEFAKIIVDGEFKDKKTTEAREMIVEKLKAAGLIEKEEEIEQNIPVSQRTGGIIEPLPKLQWFVNVNKPVKERGDKTLKQLMQQAVESRAIEITPDNYTRVYFNWIENLRDWCISRQIWYGHRIPVWYKDEEIKVSSGNPGSGWQQDPDTLDTWFSSGLWTFSTLGWPEETSDLKNFHPTSMIETGHDILFFWVARMILMSTYLLGEVPFKKIYLHGMVLDKNGKKMSKSNPETAVDPIVTIDKYGADALRMAMIVGVGAGSDNSLSEDKIKGYGKFANKLWNIARFILDNANDTEFENPPTHMLVQQFNTLAKNITSDMENYRFHLASEKVYHYIWHILADQILEESKKNAEIKSVLPYLLQNSLKLLHPFMPFVTEEIWGMLPNRQNLLIVEEWPCI
ncbi:MAG: valine--tRNA ligase [Patescibacteria group bacterium]